MAQTSWATIEQQHNMNPDQTGDLQLSFGGQSIAGTKPNNEDAFCAQLPTELSTRHLKGAVACIADGVSCSDQAQLASQTSVTHFIADYYSTPDSWPVKQAAGKVISAINSWLFHQSKHAANRSDNAVTTFSAVIVKSRTAHMLHVGDSRIYRLRNEQLELLTQDHQHHRADGQSYLTRALGIDHRLDVDYRSVETQIGDLFLLSTDGLHGFISQPELSEALSKDHDNLESLAKQLVDQALASGSDDNISCLLVKVADLPSESLREAHAKLTHLKIPPVLDVGNRIDHFRVTRVLHSGTRSHVYLARDEEQQRDVVIKAPSENFTDDIAYLEGFRREYWVGRKLNSGRVMKIYQHPHQSAFIYHVCEAIDGQTLRQWIIDNPAPSLESVRAITEEMAAAVRVLHRNAMVHRDLKPENFILTEDGRVKLIDFGTVQVEGLDEIVNVLDQDKRRENNPVGDVGYIAPEYLLNLRGTNQSDIFSLGCIVYEMLSGQLPYDAVRSNRHYPTRFQDWHYRSIRKASQDKQRDTLPLWLDNVLRKATNPRPENRYSALSEFTVDLRKPGVELLKREQSAPLLERNPVRFWQLISAILCLIIIAQWLWLGPHR